MLQSSLLVNMYMLYIDFCQTKYWTTWSVYGGFVVGGLWVVRLHIYTHELDMVYYGNKWIQNIYGEFKCHRGERQHVLCWKWKILCLVVGRYYLYTVYEKWSEERVILMYSMFFFGSTFGLDDLLRQEYWRLIANMIRNLEIEDVGFWLLLVLLQQIDAFMLFCIFYCSL